MKKTSCIALNCLIAVAVLTLPTLATGQSKLEQIEAGQLASAKAVADKVDSPARRERLCHIRQWTSAYLLRKKIEEEHSTGMSATETVGNIYLQVHIDGHLEIAISETAYPGSQVSYRIGGQQFSGESDTYTMLNANATSAIRNGAVVYFSWNDWPYNDQIDSEDAFTGFDQAYADCLAFLRAD
jgi:hypothetical protein